MVSNGIQRKLRAILSADVQNYSRLMGDDEEHTVATITAYRETISRLIGKNHGKVVDAHGDNLLAVFDSSLNALHAAIEVQQTLETKNKALPENRLVAWPGSTFTVQLGDSGESGMVLSLGQAFGIGEWSEWGFGRFKLESERA